MPVIRSVLTYALMKSDANEFYVAFDIILTTRLLKAYFSKFPLSVIVAFVVLSAFS